MQYPDWYTEYISVPYTDRFITVDGTEIHYQIWGEDSKPGLLFVHGHAAHSHWWDFIAPAFTDSYQVAAIDMSGCGDSGHRPQYSATLFASEILQVAETLSNRTVIIGHSFGGAMTRIAAHFHAERLGGIVLVDSVISETAGSRKPLKMPRLNNRYYQNLESGMKRVRLRPPQPCLNEYLLQHIARHSLKETDQGFLFKLDQALFAKMIEETTIQLPDAATMIRNLRLPKAFIYGEQSRFFPPASRSFLTSLFGSEIRKIPNAHHHVFLDQPTLFIGALKEILTTLPVKRS
ncbi:MAG TPA: alpha/beta hydrolase [Pseudomonadales bacterium]|nr:alpha/beta hydrolase [Pseudomonadales bacterium]MDP6316386.1 alpha/beta hydrolase [Pseudomonadales bacterium]MDP7314976.1 alpha/beta hydrolase [Pseudomonadales bacterium]HJP49770.1 alpha/beta hydrolase [Pseudomonadales bacterium]